MIIIRWLKASLARRSEARRQEAFKQRHGDIKCPHCRVWQSQVCAAGLPMRQHPTDPNLDNLHCGGCGKVSPWLYGPGLWLYVGDIPGVPK